jgi:hypothetical protein
LIVDDRYLQASPAWQEHFHAFACPTPPFHELPRLGPKEGIPVPLHVHNEPAALGGLLEGFDKMAGDVTGFMDMMDSSWSLPMARA